MTCQRECFNCSETEDVSWREHKKEYYCDYCIEMLEFEEDTKKDSAKIPDWNTRLDEMTKGITQCTDEELTYLNNEILKEQLKRTPFGD